MTNKTIQVDEQLKSMLHINGCQQRTAGYNEAKQGADGLDTDDMERLETIAYDEVLALIQQKQLEAQKTALDFVIEIQGKQFNRWTQQDIANFFTVLGKRYREVEAQLSTPPKKEGV